MKRCKQCNKKKDNKSYGQNALTCYSCNRDNKKTKPYYFFHSRAKGMALRGISYLVLQEVYHDQKARCYYCSVKLHKNSSTHFDHKTPRSRGGSQLKRNLVATCRDCNQLKGIKTSYEFRKFLIKYIGRFTQANLR